MLDAQLNISRQTVIGTVDSAPIPSLIEHSSTKRQTEGSISHRELRKCIDDTNRFELPIKQRLVYHPLNQLSSRFPIYGQKLIFKMNVLTMRLHGQISGKVQSQSILLKQTFDRQLEIQTRKLRAIKKRMENAQPIPIRSWLMCRTIASLELREFTSL